MKRERQELVLQKHGSLYCPSFWPNPIWFSEVLRFDPGPCHVIQSTATENKSGSNHRLVSCPSIFYGRV